MCVCARRAPRFAFEMSALGAKCCPSCSWKGKSLNQHYYNSPQCRPPPTPPPPSEQPVDTSWADSLLTNTFRSTLAQQILEMHADNYMTNAMVDRAVSLMCKAVDSTLRTCEERVARDSPAAVPVLAPVAAAVRKVTSGFLDSSNTIAFAMTTQIGFIPPMENPLEKDRDTKGELTRFYVKDLVTRILTLDVAARRAAFKASDEWKSGKLYGAEPTRYTDITDGARFRERHEICGLSLDPKELRIVLLGWEDDFTVRAICQVSALLPSNDPP